VSSRFGPTIEVYLLGGSAQHRAGLLVTLERGRVLRPRISLGLDVPTRLRPLA
jgi:hypothetical protein